MTQPRAGLRSKASELRYTLGILALAVVAGILLCMRVGSNVPGQHGCDWIGVLLYTSLVGLVGVGYASALIQLARPIGLYRALDFSSARPVAVRTAALAADTVIAAVACAAVGLGGCGGAVVTVAVALAACVAACGVYGRKAGNLGRGLVIGGCAAAFAVALLGAALLIVGR